MFTIHDLQTAPQDSRAVLKKTQEAYGMVPNLFGVLAENPGAVQAYAALGEAFGNTGLSPAEQQVVLLAVSVENGCEYCVAAHSMVADGGNLLTDDQLRAIRSDEPLSDARLEALRSFTKTVVQKRGWVEEYDVKRFADAGFQKRDLLGVITGVAMKTLSNYTNHIAETELDDAFAAHKWEAQEAAAG